MQRRRVLLAIGTVGAAGLAGCIGGRREPDGGAPTDTPDGSPTQPATSFTTTSRRCGEQTNDATVTIDDGEVTIEGTTWGSEACYIARLDSATIDEGALTVRVVAERDAPEDRACAQCIAEIEYRATIEVDSAPARVVVVHDGETVADVTP